MRQMARCQQGASCDQKHVEERHLHFQDMKNENHIMYY